MRYIVKMPPITHYNSDMAEQWAIIESFPKYSISTFGRVRHNRKGNILALHPTNGYLSASFYYETGRSTRNIHRLVALAFCDGYEDGLQVLHRNGNKLDNRADNLRWGTAQDNADDRIKMGELKPARGESHWNCKLTDDDVESIRHDPRLQRLIAVDYGVSQNYISEVKSHRVRA